MGCTEDDNLEGVRPTGLFDTTNGMDALLSSILSTYLSAVDEVIPICKG